MKQLFLIKQIIALFGAAKAAIAGGALSVVVLTTFVLGALLLGTGVWTMDQAQSILMMIWALPEVLQ